MLKWLKTGTTAVLWFSVTMERRFAEYKAHCAFDECRLLNNVLPINTL